MFAYNAFQLDILGTPFKRSIPVIYTNPGFLSTHSHTNTYIVEDFIVYLNPEFCSDA